MHALAKARKILSTRWRQHCLLTAIIALIICYTTGLIPSVSDLLDSSSFASYRTPHRTSPNYDNDSDKAIFFSLVREEELDGMIQSITDLQNRFNNNFHYDWLFVSDKKFSTSFKKKISKTFTSGKALFDQIPKEYWGYPAYIDQEKAAHSRAEMAKAGIKYGNSESYRHMCRFNSGFFYQLDSLADYRYYWRVEPNVRFKCDIITDPFEVMREGQYMYGWTMTMPEDIKTVDTLWKNVMTYVQSKKPQMPLDNLFDFVTDNKGLTYNTCHYWSNFEIGDLSFFRSAQYQDFFNYLDSTGGFFYERWGDAPIHSIAVSLFLSKDKIKHFPHTGYFHEPNQGCPASKKIREKLHCNCNPRKDWTFHYYSCTDKYYQVANMSKPDF